MTYGADMDIPNTYAEIPPGFTEDVATRSELQAAGFDRDDPGESKPGEQPVEEMLVEGEQTITPDLAAQVLRETVVRVLRDTDGAIVATWDEGRWWTPQESEIFVTRIIAELQAAGDS